MSVQKKKANGPSIREKKDFCDDMDDRDQALGEIITLKHQVANIEHRIKRRLMDTGQVDLLSVNWRALSRRSR